MEFKLNKIDTELRQQVQDSTKEGLIHRKKEIIINKDLQEENKQKFQQSLKKHSKKDAKRLSVEAEKVEEVTVEAFMDKDSKKEASRGRFLDIKR
ncbi:hypothetical protein [Clostridium cochlearium]|jgi:hypothetical protein|uniref:hypothetical protein n=1 Tax=Clostridium cochlearium TaxID=1494 RepID=UPI000BBCB01A|nr:hypothetical protein [Clostridium cochlearium]MBV1821849.1 hypothetical protein [Bacteroidales bacterium MSK.15.36]NSJ92814.1 hypothetical protein [Coprococcus sp. MSK.21.13]MBU5269563.1 hypothetical protein [Clostridium cochlearium]MCG4571617.1 hypothetical protein [Clostridium cochlearium]MCG4580679.1 hypothetical protein [Clostridium cochlearium]